MAEQQTTKLSVVVAMDASRQAENALDYYIEQLHKVGHRVVFVHVVELPEIGHAKEEFLTPGTLSGLWEEETKASKALEAKVKATCESKGVTDVCIRNVSGNKPGQSICKVAEDEKAIMVVMGTRGMGKIRRTLMGSVSDYVVHHAKCPVVVCRHAEEVHGNFTE